MTRHKKEKTPAILVSDSVTAQPGAQKCQSCHCPMSTAESAAYGKHCEDCYTGTNDPRMFAMGSLAGHSPEFRAEIERISNQRGIEKGRAPEKLQNDA